MSNPINFPTGGNGGAPLGGVTTDANRSQGPQRNGAGPRSGDMDAGASPSTGGAVQSDRLQAVQERLEATPDVDRGRIESIKNSIAQGRYPLDAAKISRRFTELESMLKPSK